MGVDEIITLEDGKEYILLSETNQNDNKYFLAVEAVNNEPTEKYELFKEVNENGELSVEEITNEELKSKLIADFEVQYDLMDEQEA